MKAKLSFILILVAVMARAADVSFEIPFTFDNAQVAKLLIGCHPEATDGYDSGRDIYVPPFGMGTGVIGIKVADDNPNMLYKDIRSTKLPQTWRIDCKPAQKPIMMRWTKGAFPAGLQVRAVTGKGNAIDMNVVSQLKVSKPDVITITVSPSVK